jgi:predicted CopG family antitoxin
MVKMVSLSEAAYALLRRHKKPNMSFSDVVNSGRWTAEPERTESTKELLDFIRTLPHTGRKEALHAKIDEIVYGVRRP